ncbi:hypothetical protein [Sulfuricurvum sp.]|uniref:hypothetical protein n=1 Tax=Sulfuricurvum sp. TaxID=2025608 RepID=UPI0026207CE0|nr:hypothetical protein [Sulfuricurvum sp.]MDD2266745.1 hypothetical protein [Sulfuricurvum sp.]MDD2783913.1 hypothetical protein [Sulfuricurvum sp.]
MALSAQRKQIIKDSSILYRAEINQINTWIYNEPDDDRCEKLYLLRAIATIDHTNRIGLLDDEEVSEEILDSVANEVNLYFPEKDDAELFDDIAILEDDIKDRFFYNPEKEKQALLHELGLSF